jgi:hypothetical protein
MKKILFLLIGLMSLVTCFSQVSPTDSIAAARAYINANITTNGQRAITGNKVNNGIKHALKSIEALRDSLNSNSTTGDYFIKVSLTSAEILALNATPKVLIAAPGAGKFIRLYNVTMRLNFGTTSYTGGSIRIKYPSGGSFIMTNSSHTNFSSIIYNPALSTTQLFTTGAENDSLVLDASSAITNGDGTIDIYLQYTIIDL